jgi:Mrp family chromosome partitioning ATPase
MNDPSGQIDGLGLSIAQRMPQGDTGFTLLVTSARAGEGKSFIATRLAERMVSLLAAPVLIVEANAENPSVHLSFPGTAEGGLFDCLRAEELLPERIDVTATARLSAMAAPCGAQMSLLFHMRSMRRILDALRDQFALTIIDAASLPQVGCLAQQADATLLVVDAAHTRRDIVQGAMASPHIARERIMGVVLNRRPEYVPPWLYKGLL